MMKVSDMAFRDRKLNAMFMYRAKQTFANTVHTQVKGNEALIVKANHN